MGNFINSIDNSTIAGQQLKGWGIFLISIFGAYALYKISQFLVWIYKRKINENLAKKMI